MERYHIFKLGLAILFYAAYCIRPMNGQETDDVTETTKKNDPEDFLVYYQGVEGKPGVDFPILSHIPRTGFNCKDVDSGYYADLDTDCQVFHICEEGKKISFLCPNGTIFQQSDLICEWWFKVNCSNSPSLYEESAEQWRNSVIRRKASRRVFQDGDLNHGAVLRTEEESSVSAKKNGKHVEFNVQRHESRNGQHRHTENSNQNFRPPPKNKVNIENQPIKNNNEEHYNNNFEIKSKPTHSRNHNSFTQDLNVGSSNIDNPQNRQSIDNRQSVNDDLVNNGKQFNSNIQNGRDNSGNYHQYRQSNHQNHQSADNNQNHPFANDDLVNNGKQFNSNIQSGRDNSGNYHQYRQSNHQNHQSGDNNQNHQFANDDLVNNGKQFNFDAQNRGENYNQNRQSADNHQTRQSGNEELMNNRNQFNTDTQTERDNSGDYQQNRQSGNANGKQFNTNNEKDISTSGNIKLTVSNVNNQANGKESRQLSNDAPLKKDNQFNNNNNQNKRGNSGKIKLTLSTVNNAVTVNGKPTTQQISRSNKKPETKNIKLTLSNLNNQVSFQNEPLDKNTNAQNQRTIPTNRGGFKYNDVPQVGFNNQGVKNSIHVTSEATSEYTNNYQSSTPKVEIKAEINSNYKTNNKNIETNYNYIGSSSTINPLSITTSSSNDADKYDLQFPQHGKPKNIDVDVKGDVKQKSTVALTRNDIQNRRLEPSDSDESQITQESSSFIKSSFNSIQNTYKPSTANPYPNHRTTYSDLKQPSYSSTKYLSTINSVTPQYLTTQPINNGKPFIGSRVGASISGIVNVSPTASYNPTESSLPVTTKSIYSSSQIFNVGNTEKYSPSTTPLPSAATKSYSFSQTFNTGNTNKYASSTTSTPINGNVYGNTGKFVTSSTSSPVSRTVFSQSFNNVGNNPTSTTTNEPFTTYSPTSLFNVGKTDFTIKPVSFPAHKIDDPYSKIPLSLFVSDQFNLGLNSSQFTQPTQATSKENLFNLGLGKVNISHETSVPTAKKPVDHQVVYGKFTKGIHTTTPPSFDINQGVQIKFDKNSKKVGIQLSKVVASSTPSATNVATTESPINPDINNNGGQNSFIGSSKSGFFVTRDSASTTPNPLSTQGFTLGADSSSYYGKNAVQKPRPFEKHDNTLSTGKFGFAKESTESGNFNSVTPTFPTYKISSASPFTLSEQFKPTKAPTLPTPLDGTLSSRYNSVYENVDNMINVLMEIAKAEENDYENETPRPGLVVPPSVGPQTLHTLAVYFANALDGIVAENEKNGNKNDEVDHHDKYKEAKESLTTLLTKMTLNRYNELFDDKDNSTETVTLASRVKDEEGKDGLQAQHSNSFVETPHIRQLAKNFSIALSSYLDDPETFRKELKELRPTEPPLLSDIEVSTENPGAEEELLNFSDADSKSSYPPIFPTIPSASPTWGYILAYNVSKESNLDVKNSLNPDLQGADSQSFVPRFNNVNTDSKNQDNKKGLTKPHTDLPVNHWTSSPGATNLWKTTFGVNPVTLNQHFGTTVRSIDYSDSDNSKEELDSNGSAEVDVGSLEQPHHEIKYDLRKLPELSLNSTQVHGILIDFMNTSKSDDSRLQRILHKLNTTEGEFLTKMREIESNPLTKRLILLLISECGANITKEIESGNLTPSLLLNSDNKEIKDLTNSRYSLPTRNTPELTSRSNSNIPSLVDPTINEDDHDARALQLLNSLYTIASKFGK